MADATRSLFASLGGNRVTVEIKQNTLNELDIFGETAAKEDPFAGFPPLKGPPKPPLQRPPQRTTPYQPKPSAPTPRDPLLYSIATFMDPSLSLFKPLEIDQKVEATRAVLATNLTNQTQVYKRLDLKSRGISLEVVQEAIAAGRPCVRPLLHYVAALTNKNMVYAPPSSPVDVFRCDQPGQDDYVYIVPGQEADHRPTGFAEVAAGAIRARAKNLGNAQQNLKKMLVKDLKAVARDLDIDLFKTTPEGKKPLLKDELVEKISAVIRSTT